MSDYSNAADTLRRIAVMYQGIVDAADAFEKLDKLDGVQSSIDAGLARLKEQQAAAAVTLSKAQAKIAEAKADRELILDGANKQAQEMITNATLRAQDIVLNAQNRAQAIADDASAGLLAKQSEIQAKVDALIDQHGKLQDAILAQQADLAQGEQQAKDLEDRISKAQAQIAKLLGQ